MFSLRGALRQIGMLQNAQSLLNHWSPFTLLTAIVCVIGSRALAQETSGTSNSAAEKGWVVRDPTTGRLYHQQLVPITVPEVRWETKQVTTTVHRPEWVSQVVNQTQTIMKPQTQMVLQAYWTGVWNPFRPPTLAYRYVPQTNWVPTTVSTPQVVAAQRLVPKQETLTVTQPVSENRTVQHLVQTEIPSSAGSAMGVNQPRMAATLAYQQPPLIRFPSVTAPVPVGAGSALAAQPPTTGLRPRPPVFQNPFADNYSAPLRTASAPSNSRDATQTGLRPTVLR
jgi:hypothetical protein